MPPYQRDEANSRRKMGIDSAEAEGLLAAAPEDDDEAPTFSAPPRRPGPERRQSSISKPPSNGQPRTPRTANRVRFDIAERESSEHSQNGHPQEAGTTYRGAWIEEEEEVSENWTNGHRSSTGQRAPLLTGIEAPSVTIASADADFNAEDLLETARPKSGMKSAFMNMANSIMYDLTWERNTNAG